MKKHVSKLHQPPLQMCDSIGISKEGFNRSTLPGTKISPTNATFDDDLPFPQVGNVSFVEGKVNGKLD